jgi:hypothetical protein
MNRYLKDKNCVSLCFFPDPIKSDFFGPWIIKPEQVFSFFVSYRSLNSCPFSLSLNAAQVFGQKNNARGARFTRCRTGTPRRNDRFFRDFYPCRCKKGNKKVMISNQFVKTDLKCTCPVLVQGVSTRTVRSIIGGKRDEKFSYLVLRVVLVAFVGPVLSLFLFVI